MGKLVSRAIIKLRMICCCSAERFVSGSAWLGIDAAVTPMTFAPIFACSCLQKATAMPVLRTCNGRTYLCMLHTMKQTLQRSQYEENVELKLDHRALIARPHQPPH